MAKKPAAKKDEPKKQQMVPHQPQGGAVAASGKMDTKDLILVGDKQDLSHIKGTNRGSENVGVEDLTIPRLEIVQGLSPAMKPGDPGYIEGAKIGDLINSVTGQNYGKEVFVVPVHYSKQWLVWKDFNQGGGFFGAFNNPADANAECDKQGGAEKHIQVVDTPTHLCLLVNHAESRVEEIMIPMTKTKAKVSRAWNTTIRLTGVDRFGRVYRVTTAQETNKKNQTYMNFVVAASGAPHPKLYALAEKLFLSVSKGERTVKMDTKGMAGEPEGEDPAAEM